VIDEFQRLLLDNKGSVTGSSDNIVVSFVLVALLETAPCFVHVLVVVFATAIFSPFLEHPKCSPIFSIPSAATHDNSESAREIF
jgi:hypothetical protein